MRRRLIEPGSIFDDRRSRRRDGRTRRPRVAAAVLAAALMVGAEAIASTSTGVDFSELLAGVRDTPRTNGFDWLREPDTEISALMPVEREHLRRQRERVDSAARKAIGRTLRGDDADLEILQRLVDERVFGPDQKRELQALGVVLGQILVEEFDYRWITYEDEEGRFRAVQDPATGRVFFPVTAISRRVEVGLPVDVDEIFLSIAPSYARLPGNVSVRGPEAEREESVQ